MKFRQIMNDLFTEDDGIAICFSKVSSAVALIGFLIIEGYVSIHGTLPADLGVQLAAVLAGCGALIGLKQTTQKDPNK